RCTRSGVSSTDRPTRRLSAACFPRKSAPIATPSSSCTPMPRDEPDGAAGAVLDDAAIVAARPRRNAVSPWEPYAHCVEDECGPGGVVEPVATLFLTNRECPFRCVMCDLWKNTLTERVPPGAIPAQIDHALSRL